MMDRTAANSRMDHGAEGARAEWLSAMQSLARADRETTTQLPADDPGADEHLHATP